MTEPTTGPRLAPLTPGERTPEQQELIGATGSELHIFQTLVRHPVLYREFIRFAGRLLGGSSLAPPVRETLILRTAYRSRSAYEWAQHLEIARHTGLSEDTIAATLLAEPAPADPHAALLLTATDQLTGPDHVLDDATWAALADAYTEQQLIEICMLVGNYAMIAGVLNSLRVALEDGQQTPDWGG